MISIKKELLVNVSQETAFRVFSQKMDAWWPRSHHVGKTPMVAMVLEPKAKGRWYSTPILEHVFSTLARRCIGIRNHHRD